MTKDQVKWLIDQRIKEGIYDRTAGPLKLKWLWGAFKGQSIYDCPMNYLVWHVNNNESLGLLHLQWIASQLDSVEWPLKTWELPEDYREDPPGHYSDSRNLGHYAGHYAGYK